jgi:hypothetical protein
VQHRSQRRGEPVDRCGDQQVIVRAQDVGPQAGVRRQPQAGDRQQGGEDVAQPGDRSGPKKRTKSVAFPRQIAMYLSRELTDFSLPKIGEEFGGRDHTTVIHAHEKISKLVQTDTDLQKQIKEISESLKI